MPGSVSIAIRSRGAAADPEHLIVCGGFRAGFVELCRLLRSREGMAHTPIYAMSGFYHLRAEAFAACRVAMLGRKPKPAA